MGTLATDPEIFLSPRIGTLAGDSAGLRAGVSGRQSSRMGALATGPEIFLSRV